MLLAQPKLQGCHTLSRYKWRTIGIEDGIRQEQIHNRVPGPRKNEEKWAKYRDMTEESPADESGQAVGVYSWPPQAPIYLLFKIQHQLSVFFRGRQGEAIPNASVAIDQRWSLGKLEPCRTLNRSVCAPQGPHMTKQIAAAASKTATELWYEESGRPPSNILFVCKSPFSACSLLLLMPAAPFPLLAHPSASGQASHSAPRWCLPRLRRRPSPSRTSVPLPPRASRILATEIWWVRQAARSVVPPH